MHFNGINKHLDVSLTVGVAPKDYNAVIVAGVSQLPAEAMCWTDSTTFGEYESFTH